MKNRLLFGGACLGIIIACVSAYFFAIKKPAQPPVFDPASNPYKRGIYAEGVVESEQNSGSNVSIYPEVAGVVREVRVSEGSIVRIGDPLIQIDDSVQRAATKQQAAQMLAAHALLEELQAQPRPENLQIAVAQVDSAQATLKTTADALDKQQTAFKADARSISRDALDVAINANAVARANLAIAQRQLDLTKAGAWSYDIRNQQMQYEALNKAHASSEALLAKYILRAPSSAIVLSVNTTVGSYISPQGAYDMYTQSALPVVVLGSPQTRLHVRCYIDEILISRLLPGKPLDGQMTVRGTTKRVPLRFERIQPFVSPKIELSDQRQERVDVRVLPVIFSFEKPSDIYLYPGELVDVYLTN